ncbi:hypothetical protein GCM10010279_29580 [Streptomyces mutabilis]|nr:hypothetical protein GCM10010279_29580 [Streptomyces mutabilis]
MRTVVRAVKDHRPEALVVASGYADAHRIGCVNPPALPDNAAPSGADAAMLDTAVRDGTRLFRHAAGHLRRVRPYRHGHRRGARSGLRGRRPQRRTHPAAPGGRLPGRDGPARPGSPGRRHRGELTAGMPTPLPDHAPELINEALRAPRPTGTIGLVARPDYGRPDASPSTDSSAPTRWPTSTRPSATASLTSGQACFGHRKGAVGLGRSQGGWTGRVHLAAYLCKERNAAERLIGKLKATRGIAARYGKPQTATSSAFVCAPRRASGTG